MFQDKQHGESQMYMLWNKTREEWDSIPKTKEKYTHTILNLEKT